MIRAAALGVVLALALGPSDSAADADAIGLCMADTLAARAGCDAALAATDLDDWDRAALLERRAGLLRRDRAFEAAIADYDAALALAPDKPSLLAGRGAALGESPGGLDTLARAVADFDAALAIRPGDPELLAQRAHAKALLGDFDGAIADADAALAPGLALAALTDEQTFTAVAENRAFALNARAWARLEAGDRVGALADAEAAALALDDEATIRDTLAHALAAAGRIDDAVDAHRDALRLGGEEWAATYRERLTARGFAPRDGEEGLIDALRACAEIDCRPMADGPVTP